MKNLAILRIGNEAKAREVENQYLLPLMEEVKQIEIDSVPKLDFDAITEKFNSKLSVFPDGFLAVLVLAEDPERHDPDDPESELTRDEIVLGLLREMGNVRFISPNFNNF